MKKILLLALIFLKFSYFCYSQDDRLKKAEALQIAFLTKELGLTPEEAQKFWPIYNNYKAELRKARLENPRDIVASEEKVVAIRKKYQAEFKKVLSDDSRVNKVFSAEKNFREMLRKELESRNAGANINRGGKLKRN